VTQPLRIAVADDELDIREHLHELLTRLGHQAVAVATGKQLVELCRATSPDLVISDIKMPDMDGIAAAEAVNHEKETPVIVVSAYHDAELLDRAAAGNVMAYLVKPVSGSDIQAAVHVAMYRFRQYLEVWREADSLRQALADRKLVEQAKGVVMKRLGVDEEEAFSRLKKLASRRNRKLVDVAREVLPADEVFQDLEGVAG
jgi:response regulator NasT